MTADQPPNTPSAASIKHPDIVRWKCPHCPATGRERFPANAIRKLNLHVECQHPLISRGLRAAHIYLNRKAAA